MDYHLLELGNTQLQSGDVLQDARLAYQTWGELNGDKSNAILLPSFITGTHEGYLPFIGPGKCFDPERHFIIGTNLFGNGLSTSPSNAEVSQRGADFPHVVIGDSVAAQHRLITETFGIERLALVAGYSMGAQQAYQWAVDYPDMVARLAPWCGTARSRPHTAFVFRALRAVLEIAPDWNIGRYDAPPLAAMRAVARVYAPWGLSQGWYAREGWTTFGFPDAETFTAGFWEATMEKVEPNDFLAQAHSLSAHDVAQAHGDDLRAALGRITARTLVMPGSTDLYFPVDDAAEDASCIAGAQLRVINSDWGHFAGIGIDAASTAQIDAAIKELMSGA